MILAKEHLDQFVCNLAGAFTLELFNGYGVLPLDECVILGALGWVVFAFHGRMRRYSAN